jgi:hypothetical protein
MESQGKCTAKAAVCGEEAELTGIPKRSKQVARGDPMHLSHSGYWASHILALSALSYDPHPLPLEILLNTSPLLILHSCLTFPGDGGQPFQLSAPSSQDL